jgi:protease-4
MGFEEILLGRVYALNSRESGESGESEGDKLIEKNEDRRCSDRVRRIYSQYGNVAIVTIDGAIDKRIATLDMQCYGGVDLCDVDEALAMARNSSADKIVIDMHSPGGSVVGVAETHARILALCEEKEVHCYIDVQACSAGYYLASACDHIAAAPSACVGSIGVYLALIDQSRRLEAQGVTVNVMQGGQWKTVGADYKPLADDERAMLQSKVDKLYADFKAAVNLRRPQVADSTMQGQWMEASEGLELGLVDELTAETLDEYVSRLLVI